MSCTEDQAEINYYTAAISVDNTQLASDTANRNYWQEQYEIDGCGMGGFRRAFTLVLRFLRILPKPPTLIDLRVLQQRRSLDREKLKKSAETY